MIYLFLNLLALRDQKLTSLGYFWRDIVTVHVNNSILVTYRKDSTKTAKDYNKNYNIYTTLWFCI